MNAKELLHTYLSSIQNAEAAAALFADDGVIELPMDLHRYPLPTYEEDWRALQTSDRTELWDPIKFVPLSADGATSLSLGAEARVTYERFATRTSA